MPRVQIVEKRKTRFDETAEVDRSSPSLEKMDQANVQESDQEEDQQIVEETNGSRAENLPPVMEVVKVE